LETSQLLKLVGKRASAPIMLEALQDCSYLLNLDLPGNYVDEIFVRAASSGVAPDAGAR